MTVEVQENSDLTGILTNKFGHPATVLWRTIELRIIAKALENIALEEPILDLGCAEGEIAEIVFENKKIIGLDNCWELLSKNKKVKTYAALFLADGCHMPYKNGVFATVFSNCVIEHIPPLDILLNEISRVLKPGGLFIFTVPSHKFGEFLFFRALFRIFGLKKAADWYSSKRNALLNHYHCYSHEQWQSTMQKYGLKLNTHSYYMPPKAVMLWDFLAAVYCVLNKVGLGALTAKKTSNGLKKFINNNSEPDKYSGGGLLVIAQKIKQEQT